MSEHFKNLKIGKKIVYSFAVIILLFIFSISISIASITSISKDVDELYNNQLKAVSVSEILKTDLQGYAKGLARIGLLSQPLDTMTDSARLEEKANKITQMNNFYEDIKKDIDSLTKIDGEFSVEIAQLNKSYDSLEALTNKMLTYYEKGQIAKGIALSSGEIETTTVSMATTTEKIISKVEKSAEEKYNETENLVQNLITATIITSIVLILAVIGLCLTLIRSINKPLSQIEAAAKRFAEGDLHQSIDYYSDDEIGQLAESLRVSIASINSYLDEIHRCMHLIGNRQLDFTMDIEFKGDFVKIEEAIKEITGNLTGIIVQINASADQTLSGAEQIAASSEALSQATLEQASSVEELGATINDISDRISESAENAMITSNITQSAGAEMTKSSEQMNEMSLTMDKMKAMSSDIKGIVKEIEDIAFQTNILALNAAVEAARAGDFGKGFAVVANEIRRLSGKTTEASKNTGTLINETVQLMENGALMAKEASKKMSEVVESADEVIGKVNDISQSSNEQASAIVQLRQSIELISDVVQENSATAEENAASSEELSGQMEMLKELVDTFSYKE